MRNKLGRTITGAAVLALTVTGTVTGTANASTVAPDTTGAITETANAASTDASDNASADVSDTASTDVSDTASTEVSDTASADVPDAVWTSRGWPAPSADPHLPDASGNIPADQEEEPQPLIDEHLYGPDSGPTPASADPVAAASTIDGHGTSNWAYNNLDTRWEYRTDCANFVSKALYHGGGMQMRPGGRKADNAWWQGRYGFGKSWAWTSADYLRRHVTKWRHSSIVPHEYNAHLGDLVFFKWKKERVYNHVAIVSAMVQGHARIVQHGLKNETTLAEVIQRYSRTSNPIEKVTIVRPKDRN
ncbi:amidase domain-containing protein [Streptomyces sp. NPDC052301]|uniref:amidase domain-containing protein n=1 Tax=Streptomyces sp. NPDC052301 TaxID=3365687 RepID=UPI0037D4D79F